MIRNYGEPMFGLLKKTQQTPEVELIELMQKLKNANSNVISALHMALCTQLNIFFGIPPIQ
jgi:hypothetical protein